MDRLLQLEKLDTDPSSSAASKDWLHWLLTFENFLTVLPREGLDRLLVLTNCKSQNLGVHRAMINVWGSHWRTESPVCQACQWILSSPVGHWTADEGVTLAEFLQALKSLSKVCNFQNVTEIIYRDEAGLLENNTLDLSTMFTQAGLWMLPKGALNLTTHQPSGPNYCHSLVPAPTITMAPAHLLWRSHRQFLQQRL